ncbi:HAMP domain-containing histidine kinase [bacterium]|nr:HAMP domain-containing histidine kinase [bacterium]
MSRIFEGSLLKEEIQAYWKRFAASVTGFADKYQFDPFLRTQINVIGMLVAFSVFLLALIGILVDYLYHDISLAIVTGVRDSILMGGGSSGSVPALEDIRSDNLSAIAVITATATVAFGYLLTRVALSPTRNALSSQKQFIGNIAHELRTPLSIIKTNTEVTLLGETVSSETRKTLESTVEELDRLSDIINNLLSLSASVRPERIEFKPIDVGSVIGDVVRKLDGLAKLRNLEVSTKVAQSCYVLGNYSALEQILTNLVKNAINYTARGGTISVVAEQIGASHVEIVVNDSGAGIARQDLFHIFEPFYRAEPSRNRAKGGSGLGLAIVSELVRLHHGKITVRSAVGRGTTVVVSLPLAAIPEPAPSLRDKNFFDEVAVDYSHRKI